MKTKQIRNYKREFKLRKMELQEQELDEEVYYGLGEQMGGDKSSVMPSEMQLERGKEHTCIEVQSKPSHTLPDISIKSLRNLI